MTKAVIYIRSNGAKEDNLAYIAQQVHELVDYAYKNKIIVRQIFIDPKSPAKSFGDAPNLARLLSLLQNEFIDYVITHDPSRLSRDFQMYSLYKNVIEISNTKLRFVRNGELVFPQVDNSKKNKEAK